MSDPQDKITELLELVARSGDDRLIALWYSRYDTLPTCDDVEHTGPLPSVDKMWEVFNKWLVPRREQLRKAICAEWKATTPTKKDVLTATAATALLGAIESLKLEVPVDLPSTVAILVLKGYLDDLCG